MHPHITNPNIYNEMINYLQCTVVTFLAFTLTPLHSEPIRNDFTWPPTFRHECHLLKESPDTGDWCNDGSGSQNPTVAIIGDSFSTSFSQLFLYLQQYKKFSYQGYGRGQCPPLIDYGPPACYEAAKFYLDYAIKNPNIKTIVLSAYWESYYSGKNYDWLNLTFTTIDFELALNKTLSYLQSSNKNIVIILSPPVGLNPRTCAKRAININDSNQKCILDRKLAEKNNLKANAYITQVGSRFKNVKFYDPFLYLCNTNECMLKDGEKILYIDHAHLSTYGGEYLAKKSYNTVLKLLGN